MRTVIATAALVLIGLACVPTSSATIEGPCSATVNGVNLDTASASDPDTAIKAEAGSVMPYTFTSAAGVTSYRGEAKYMGFTITVDDKEAEGTETTTSGDFDLAQLEWLGHGVYAMNVHATLADGSTCDGNFLVYIEGGLLDGVASIAALGLVLATTGGIVAATVNTVSGVKAMMLSVKIA